MIRNVNSILDAKLEKKLIFPLDKSNLDCQILWQSYSQARFKLDESLWFNFYSQLSLQLRNILR